MPASIFEYGEARLQRAIERLGPDARQAAERDRHALLNNPGNHGLPLVAEWKADDEVPWPTQVVLLGGELLVRYAVIEGYPRPAIIGTSRLGPQFSSE